MILDSSASETELLSLIENQVSEDLYIEYKRDFPKKQNRNDSFKKELLADITAFANASGGILVFGIVEEGGIPIELSPLSDIDLDEASLWISNLVNTSVDPRIPNINVTQINIDTNKGYLLIIIPNSNIKPHMITYKGSSRFYLRYTNGKDKMKSEEIRNSFISSYTHKEMVSNFRNNRIKNIKNGNTPLPVPGSIYLVLHILPVNNFNNNIYSADNLRTSDNNTRLTPLVLGNSRGSMINYDGYVTYSSMNSNEVYGYSQVYRDGKIEVVDSVLLWSGQEKKLLVLDKIEITVLANLIQNIRYLKEVKVPPPYLCFLSLIGVRDFERYTGPGYFDGSRLKKVMSEDLLLPDIVVAEEDYVPSEMKPIFDILWNIFDIPSSHNYDESGTYSKIDELSSEINKYIWR